MTGIQHEEEEESKEKETEEILTKKASYLSIAEQKYSKDACFIFFDKTTLMEIQRLPVSSFGCPSLFVLDDYKEPVDDDENFIEEKREEECGNDNSFYAVQFKNE